MKTAQEEGCMVIEVKHVNGVTVLTPKGKLTIEGGDRKLREAVEEARITGAQRILINMSRTTKVDSSGVGELISLFTTVGIRGGRVGLCELREKPMNTMQLTSLITVFPVYASEGEAIEAPDLFHRGP